MRIITYQRGDRALLEDLARKLAGPQNLLYPAFVDHYYAGSPWCRLQVVLDVAGDIAGVLGVERMEFTASGLRLTLGFGSNFVAFQPGVGGLLYLRWLKECDFGLGFGATPDAERIYLGQGWVRFANIGRFHVNRAYQRRPGDAWWKNLARCVLRRRPRADLAERARRVLRDGAPPVEVVEERRFTEDLLPRSSPFSFRLSPGVDYLNWRYNTELDFVRYQLFRVVSAGETAGYVVVNRLPERWIVAHCDGEDPLLLTEGIFAALAVSYPRHGYRPEVFLASAHPAMQEGFRRFGFRRLPGERPVYIGGRRPPPVPEDTRGWLVGYDWGDTALRPPLLGCPAIGAAGDRPTHPIRGAA